MYTEEDISALLDSLKSESSDIYLQVIIQDAYDTLPRHHDPVERITALFKKILLHTDQEKVIDMALREPLSNMPLYAMSPHGWHRAIARWRLSIAR